MVFVFDLGGVLSDIDVHGFVERFQQLMPVGEQCSMDPEVLLAGGGDSFLHDYELGLLTTDEVLERFHALCRPEVTYEQIKNVWLSELAPVQESKKALLRRLRQEGHMVCLLSNTNDMHWQYIEPMFRYDGYTLEDHFDHVFLSYRLHMYKPEKTFLDAVCRAVPQKEPIIYIDDAERNRKAGEQEGWKTFENIDALLAAFDL
jgi:putative hydrolase of the HAD superfamily